MAKGKGAMEFRGNPEVELRNITHTRRNAANPHTLENTIYIIYIPTIYCARKGRLRRERSRRGGGGKVVSDWLPRTFHTKGTMLARTAMVTITDNNDKYMCKLLRQLSAGGEGAIATTTAPKCGASVNCRTGAPLLTYLAS